MRFHAIYQNSFLSGLPHPWALKRNSSFIAPSSDWALKYAEYDEMVFNDRLVALYDQDLELVWVTPEFDIDES